ncbi:SgcJ/EcaC family oxidoreductase [Microbacterium sp. RU33B]|uniref:YybH family protein n=1 Tax=Microbacterium sp. RU33B TaxID=1907390 RepID=UPI00095DD064|nr:SgcJ/EcaC family oxidoreductase [Microbacterium sp. RU33B]SIT89774.1 conserved hypothetical protein [Microbacterium sp. RU33B]
MKAQHLEPAQPTLSGVGELDRQAVTAVMAQLVDAFAHRDSALLDGIFAEDVDWFTGLGSAVRGRAAVIQHFHQHFLRPDFPRTAVTSGADWLVHRLDEDRVVVLAPLQVVGSVRPTSTDRDTRSVHVLSRLASGAWCITLQLFHSPLRISDSVHTGGAAVQRLSPDALSANRPELLSGPRIDLSDSRSVDESDG